MVQIKTLKRYQLNARCGPCLDPNLNKSTAKKFRRQLEKWEY